MSSRPERRHFAKHTRHFPGRRPSLFINISKSWRLDARASIGKAACNGRLFRELCLLLTCAWYAKQFSPTLTSNRGFIAFFVDVFLQSGDRLAPVSFCRLTRDIIRFVFLQLRNGGGFAAIDFALIVPGEGDGISGRLPFGSIGGILFVFHLCLKVARCSFVLVVFSNLPFTAEWRLYSC